MVGQVDRTRKQREVSGLSILNMGAVQSGAHSFVHDVNFGRDTLWIQERHRRRHQRRTGHYDNNWRGQSSTGNDRRKLLKRTKSLAVISEDDRHDKQTRQFRFGEPIDICRRSQLIPRAKLIDRCSLKDRLSKSQQHLGGSNEKSSSKSHVCSVPVPVPVPRSRGVPVDCDRLNILDWPESPLRYHSIQGLNSVTELVNVAEDGDWLVEENRNVDCIYTQARRKRKEHRSLDSIFLEDKDELEYIDVLKLLPLSNVRLGVDESSDTPNDCSKEKNYDRQSTSSIVDTEEDRTKIERRASITEALNLSKIAEIKRSSWNTASKELSVIADRSRKTKSSENEIESDSDTNVDEHSANALLINSSHEDNEPIEEAEDCKSIWISDLEELEDMSRRPQVLRIVDSDVTKQNRRSVMENDSRSKVLDEVDEKVVGSVGVVESEDPETRIRTKNGEEDSEIAEGEHVDANGSCSKRNEGKLERIIKETSSILGKACSAVKGSLGFEARSESSDLGLGSESGSESRRRSVDDGVDVVDESSSPKCADESSTNDADDDRNDADRNRTILTRSRSCANSIERQDRPEFDHIRYKIVKSDMFSKGMFGSTKRDASFDGLMQYLQEYSFQELLVDNNVVIIEPVRAETIERKSPIPATIDKINGVVGTMKTGCRIAGAIEKKQRSQETRVTQDAPRSPKQTSSLRRHFFYHPIRVNRELIDEELPDPDTVRNVRKMFEGTLKLKSPCSEVARGGSCKKSASMKDLSRIDDREGSSRCSSRARDLTRLFENMEKLSVAGGTRDELDSPTRSESRTRILAQSFEAKSGNTSPSDLALLKGKVSRYLNSWDAGSVSSGVSSDYPDTDPGSAAQCVYSSEDEADYRQDEEEEDYDDEDLDAELTGHAVSQDVLRKIRECGTSVTYYGGKIVGSSNGPLISPMVSGSRCLRKILRNEPKGSKDLVKFRLVKSNSCDSRLELAGRLPMQVGTMKGKLHAGDADCERRPDLRDSPIMETPSIEITTIDRLEEAESTVCKRELPVVVGLEPKREENKDPEVFRTDFKLGRLEDCKSYANRFEDRWQINEIGAGARSDFGKMEFEEFEVLDDSLDVTDGGRC